MILKIIVFIILLFILFGCGNSNKDEEDPPLDISHDMNSTSLSTEFNSNKTYRTPSTLYTLSELLEEPYLKTQWGIFYDQEFFQEKGIDKDASINGNEIYKNYTGKGVRIAIIDDGFDTNHPELLGRIHSTHNFSQFGEYNDVSHSHRTHYHGTAVAGIIASNMNREGIRGVAPEAELILIKFSQQSSIADFIAMFQTAIDNGADIINCSWGTGNVPDAVAEYLLEISKNARDGKGVLIVFATGNSNKNLSNDESSLESVIGVSATDHYNLRASYSNFGPEIDIMVPGGSIGGYGISTLDPLEFDGVKSNDYSLFDDRLTFTGTSASAPILSGALALLLEHDNSLTREEVIQRLEKSSDKISKEIPYILDMENFGTNRVILQGQLGTSQDTLFFLRVTSFEDGVFNDYTPYIFQDSWSYDLDLKEGTYKAELIKQTQNFDEEVTYYATDSFFEVNLQKETKSRALKNDYYGFGKLNLENLIYFDE